ncbi:MAG: hypothetical protein AAB448_01680 [Patescibacteria group bacterium]
MKLVASNIHLWIVPALFPALLFGILTWMYLAPSGEKTISWEAGESSVLIGRPLPDDRTAECNDDRGACIAAIDEPLYMSVTPPAGLWHGMRVEVSYDLNGQQKFELGLMQDFATQSFVLLPLEPEEDWQGWQTGSASFVIENVQKENGAYKLILSLPGVEDVAEKPIINSAKVIFTRNTSVVGEMKWLIKGLWVRRP